jgi:hypothetical protein
MAIHNHVTRTVIDLAPVIAKNEDWPGGSKENALFWSASPSGEIELAFTMEAKHGFELGSYYYIDMRLLDDASKVLGRTWKLWEVSQTEGSLSFHMGLGYDNEADLTQGSFKLTIDNDKAWPEFKGNAGTKWQVIFTKSEEGNVGCPYTNPEG